MSENFVDPDEIFDSYSLIDRQPFAEYLTNYLISKSHDGYVLNLNAEWGAGKTTFLQCWYNLLRHNHPVIYFDAWKSDFTHDPMIALMDCFHSQLSNYLHDEKNKIIDLLEKGMFFVRRTTPSLVVGYLKNKVGMDGDESLLKDISDEFQIDSNECGDALKEILKGVLEQRAKVNGISDFKNALSELSETSLKADQGMSKPIFVLIDELDRCRPTYAIELIECVKHFFKTKNFVFVLATDTDQLQHSVRAIYGEGFDSESYLSRFFDTRATLPAPTTFEFIKAKLQKVGIDNDKATEFIEAAFNWHEVYSLREISKILQVLDFAANGNKEFKLLPLLLLSILKHRFSSFYTQYKESIISPPYRSNTHDTRGHGDSTLIKAKRSQTFVVIRKNQDIAFIFNHILQSIEQYEYRDIADFKATITQRGGDETANISQLSQAFSNEYTLGADNISSSNASKKDYFNLIDFAGYID